MNSSTALKVQLKIKVEGAILVTPQMEREKNVNLHFFVFSTASMEGFVLWLLCLL